MKKERWIIIAGSLLVLALALIFLVFPSRPASFQDLRQGRDFNVIVITLDTTRADRIGVYGCSRVKTPVLDGFAAQGLRFERCIAQTPLTLPSHATIMTGTFPPFHGVRDNGGFIVPAALETMAETFKKNGYQTAAFLAAYVLDSRWGLNQGFDLYYDRFDTRKLERIAEAKVQRPANEVLDQVLPWLDQKKSEKFFAWIHLYDPHVPYEPPSPYDTEYADDPYLGEIAFVDSQLGRLRDFLEANKLAERTFIVIAGDHGEALGQHKEDTHGFFVYQEVLQVPLIFVAPFPRIQGRVSPRLASLADIMPSVLDMCGLPAPAEVQGRSLVGEFFKASPDLASPAYAETYLPRFQFGWSELRSVQDDRYQLIVAPALELYDLKEDPQELNNIASSKPDVARSLLAEEARLEGEYSRNAPRPARGKLDEETREKLAALGYIGTFASAPTGPGQKLANPKDKIDVFNELSHAQELGQNGRVDEAIPIVTRIISQDPEVVGAYFILGNFYYGQNRYAEAIAQFKIAVDKKPDDVQSIINIAQCYIRMNQQGQAESFILDQVRRGIEDSILFFNLGKLYVRGGKPDQAIPAFKKCLALNPHSASANSALARVYFMKNDLAQAESHAREAIRLDPKLIGAHYALAQVLHKSGRVDEAEEEYKREIEVSPTIFKVYLDLAMIYKSQGKTDLMSEFMEKGLKLAPESALNYFLLAEIYLERGQKLEEAVSLVEKGIALKPQRRDLAAAYFLLSKIYTRMGDTVRAEESARKSREVGGFSPLP